MVFAVPADHRVKFKIIEKRGKYLDFAIEQNKKKKNKKKKNNETWKWKEIPIVIGAFGTIP